MTLPSQRCVPSAPAECFQTKPNAALITRFSHALNTESKTNQRGGLRGGRAVWNFYLCLSAVLNKRWWWGFFFLVMSFVSCLRAFWRALWAMSVFSGDSTPIHSQGAKTQRKTIKVHFGPLMKCIKTIRAGLVGRDRLFLSTRNVIFTEELFLSTN